jgi:hypothetical protein
MERLDRASPPPSIRFDPVSRAALLAFAVQFAAILAISVGFGGQTPLNMLIVLSALAGQCNSIAGLFTRQRFGRGPLNRWDVAMMLFAVSLGARFFQ